MAEQQYQGKFTHILLENAEESPDKPGTVSRIASYKEQFEEVDPRTLTEAEAERHNIFLTSYSEALFTLQTQQSQQS